MVASKRVSSLKPHPLSLAIYGGMESGADLQGSIAEFGVRTPLTVTKGGVIVKGMRRWLAAKALGLKEVPCIVTPLTDPLEIEIDLLEDNRFREKTNEQKAREFRERKRIEAELARRPLRVAAGGRRAGRGRPKAKAASNGKGVESFPPPVEHKSRDLAAATVGWSGRQAEKAAKVLAYAEETGDRSLLALMNGKSVDSAHAAVKRLQEGVKVPPFVPQHGNVWNFSRPTPGLGEKYPGQVPGDILRNLFWLYTAKDDLVVDLFAGGGVTMDAAAWWNAEAKKADSALWPVLQMSFDLVPSRKGIAKHDCSQPPHVPRAARGASLYFLDPPYWKQKRGDYSADPTNLANLTLAEFHRVMLGILGACAGALAESGHVALIIGATQSSGEYIDHSAFLMGGARKAGLAVVQRVIVPYTTQQFSAADVAWAKRERRMLKAYRDLIVFRRAGG